MNKKPTKKAVEEAAKNMDAETALKFIEIQAINYDMNLDSLKEKYQRLVNRYIAEKKRVESMYTYERECYKKGYAKIGGSDEVGRGPLAGPVVAACVILKPNDFIPDINDSKKLSESKREKLYELIMERAIDVGIGVSDNLEIDSINILNATKNAMLESIRNLKSPPDYLLLDAINLSSCNIPQKSIVKGDALSATIAAASIIAKVTRDRMMCEYADKYPYYGFKSNKGYGTKEHIEAIKKYGCCSLHRKLFVRNFT